MTPRLSPSQGQIVRALAAYLSKDGKDLMMATPGGLVVEAIESRPWTSLTFAGEHHRIVVRLPAGAVPDPVDAGADLAVAGRIVAVERAGWAETPAGPRLTIELLALASPR